MSKEILIRTYQEDDKEQIAVLMNELGYPSSELEIERRMRPILADSDYKTLVATFEGTLVGMIGMIKLHFWEQNGCFVRVQALVVKDGFRNRGGGKQLIQACEAWAREIGALSIALNSGNKESREAAHKFYPKMGFEHRSSGYLKKIR